MRNFNIANVLDTEATCYEGGVFPPGEMQEVIEFGITTVDLASRRIVKTISIPVLPVMSSVSPYCTQLTGWTHARLLKQGVAFSEALRRLKEKHGARGRLLVTDSNGDLELVGSQCRQLGVVYPFGEDHLNVATLFALLTRQRRNLSLEEMLAAVGLTFEGTPHRAGTDSRNIARLLLALLDRGSFEPLVGAGSDKP